VKLIFSEGAWDDYLYFQKKERKIVKRINLLIKDINRSPLKGLGKPEELKYALTGYWSRRINDEHRIVYRVEGDSVLIAQLRHHY